MVSAIGVVLSVKNVRMHTNAGVYAHIYLCSRVSYWGDDGLHVPNVKLMET